jgi:hypothetical protein
MRLFAMIARQSRHSDALGIVSGWMGLVSRYRADPDLPATLTRGDVQGLLLPPALYLHVHLLPQVI